MDTLKIGQYIQHLRKSARLTQKQLAESLNISFQAVSKWENGDALPDTGLLLDLCDVLNTTADKLLNGGSFTDSTRRLMRLEDVKLGFQYMESLGKLFGEDCTFFTGMVEGINEKMNIDLLAYLKDSMSREVMYAEVLIQGILSGRTVDMEEIESSFQNKELIETIRKYMAKTDNGQTINQKEVVQNQYSSPKKLKARVSIHEKYSTNKQGFGPWILSNYDIRAGARVLELGCGTGSIWLGQEDIIRRCVSFVLSDLSEGMLKTASETLKNIHGIEYQVIDIQKIPFPDDSFDIVIANMMLYHVPDLKQGLREVRRVLKKGGTFYCATYGENGIMEYITDLFKDCGIPKHPSGPFTLQNGGDQLHAFFDTVELFRYIDSLAVTDIDDLVDYISSLSTMTELKKLPRKTLRSVLRAHQQNGVLNVPKDYGMFIARG